MTSPYISLFTAGDDVESALPWSRTSNATRRTRQNCPDGLLLLDRLLQLAQVDPLLYPPTDFPALRRLLSAIHDSESFDTLKKNCLVYYLLKDYNDGRELPYAKARRIPKRFVMTTDAYWAIDNKQFDIGVKKLCSPGVTPDFMAAILGTLATQVSDSKLSSSLIADLVTYATPTLTSLPDIQVVITACLRQSRPDEAFVWMRKLLQDTLVQLEGEGEEEDKALAKVQQIRQNIIGVMLSVCFTSDPPLSSTVEKLLYLPFSLEEDVAVLTWINNASSSSSSVATKSLPMINEWATSRLVAEGRYVEAITILSSSLSSLRTSSEGHSKAQRSLKELYAALPPIQRSLVDLTLGQNREQARQDGSSKQSNGDLDATSGKITNVPWLPTPALPNLPIPRSLLDARANASELAIAKAGGPKISKTVDLPMSAGGLLRESSLQPGIGQNSGRRDERMDILQAVRRAESPMKGITRTTADGNGVDRLSGSPFRSGNLGTPSGSRRGGEGSLFSYASTSGTPQQSKPTVPSFGLSRPPATQVSRLDFSEQLRKHQQDGQQQSGGQPSTSTPRPPRRVAPDEQKEAQPPATTAGSQSQSSRRQLPPGAFPMSGSVTGSTIGENTDSEGSDGEAQAQLNNSRVTARDYEAPPPKSTRGAGKQASGAPPKEKLSRQRTASSKDLTAPTPAKKGKKNESAKEVEPTPRRSKRLGSVAPSEPEGMMEPDEDESPVENSMMHVGGGRGAKKGGGAAAKTPRRRKP